MRKGGGKAKGSEFEREICKRLSLWVTHGTQEDVYWRSAMSGGRSTVAHAKGKRLAAQAGDISCIHPAGETFINMFLCECKAYSDLNYAGLLTNRGHLYDFWKIVKKEAAQYGKMPFLIARQNRQPVTICLDVAGHQALSVRYLEAILIAPDPGLFIFDAEWFLENVDPPVK